MVSVLQPVFPLILDLVRKCRKRCENVVTNHKQQCHLLKVLCDLKQKKGHSHTETAKSFLFLSVYFKTNETEKVFR